MVSEEERLHQRIKARVKNLIDLGRKSFYVPEYQDKISDGEVLGVIVAKFHEWTFKPIIETVLSALEDANFHTLREEIENLLDPKATA